MSQKRYKIYVLIDPRDNEIRYVGLTKRSLNERLTGHICSSKKLKNSKTSHRVHKADWINLLIENEYRPIIQLIEKGLNKENVHSREEYWIEYYLNKGCRLINATPGGEGIRDFKHSDKTKALLKEKLTGRKLSSEHKKNISEARKGVKLSDDSKKKLSNKVKEEWSMNPDRLERMKLRTGSANPNYGGKSGPVIEFNEYGLYVQTHIGLNEAAETTGIAKKWIRSQCKKAKNYLFIFQKELEEHDKELRIWLSKEGLYEAHEGGWDTEIPTHTYMRIEELYLMYKKQILNSSL